MAGLGLAAVLAGLREELTAAIDEGSAKGMHFQLNPIELTLQMVVTDEGSGKVGWKVLEVGGTRKSQSTQTLVLRLTPVWKTQDGKLVQDLTVASAGEAGAKIGPQP